MKEREEGAHAGPPCLAAPRPAPRPAPPQCTCAASALPSSCSALMAWPPCPAFLSPSPARPPSWPQKHFFPSWCRYVCLYDVAERVMLRRFQVRLARTLQGDSPSWFVGVESCCPRGKPAAQLSLLLMQRTARNKTEIKLLSCLLSLSLWVTAWQGSGGAERAGRGRVRARGWPPALPRAWPQVSHNQSLDGVLDTLNSRNMTGG